jgi:hypothetical protein
MPDDPIQAVAAKGQLQQTFLMRHALGLAFDDINVDIKQIDQ